MEDTSHYRPVLKIEEATDASASYQQQLAGGFPALPHVLTTAVDGQGMWRAWTRVFEKPESACLDLLDNCLDATLHKDNKDEDFHGRVVMESLEGTETGITITNNSCSPIKSLDEALTVYKSTKNSDTSRAKKDSLRKDAIGENGVGLKHGCATLSDCSFVLTRNQNSVEVGVIAKALQSPHGVYLPSFSLDVPHARDLGDIIFSIKEEANEQITAVFAKELGKGSSDDGIEKLATQIQQMFQGIFQEDDHVFRLIICDLHHSKKVVIDIDAEGPPLIASKVFLDEIKTMLPEYYINIPSEGFDFIIDGTRTHFTYWQKRLVELTEFRINIPKNAPIEDMPDFGDVNNHWCDIGYNIRIYCGFDAQRMKKEKENFSRTSCKVYIYSRQAGRLIEKQTDARNLLNLHASGTDFMQGLTVIIADIESELPLMPTKDGIAWSEQRGGDIHKSNLFAWAGGVAGCYWSYHFKQIKEKDKTKTPKDLLARIVKSFARDQSQLENEASNTEITRNIVDGDFSSFEGVKWRKRMAKNTDRLVIHKAPGRLGFEVQKGDDTIFEITTDCIKQIIAEVSEGKRVKQEAQNNCKKRPARKKSTPLRNADYVSSSYPDSDQEAQNDSSERKKRPTKKKKGPARNADYVASLPGFDHAPSPVARLPTAPDASLSLAGQKRPTSAVNYCEILSSSSDSDTESDENEVAIVTPARGPARKKKARLTEDDDIGRQLLEKDIQLKEEQLKTLKAEREAQEAKKQSQDGQKLVRQLLSQLERYKIQKASTGAASRRDVSRSGDTADLQEQLRRMTEERDTYKRRIEELELVAGPAAKPTGNRRQELTGQSARRSGARVDSTIESGSEDCNASWDRIESI